MNRKSIFALAVVLLVVGGAVGGRVSAAPEAPLAAEPAPLQPAPAAGQGGLTVLSGLDIHSPTVIAFDPTNSKVIYAGAQDGLARSTDGGQSWHLLSTGLLYPRQIVLDPLNSQALYACRRALPEDPGTAVAGVYGSTDGGVTWRLRDRGMAGQDIFSLALDPRAPQVLYAGSRDGLVWKSSDAGESWATAGAERPALEGNPPRTVIQLIVHPHSGDLYAVEDAMGTFCSRDGGQTWTTVHRASGFLTVDKNSGTLYLAGRNLWRSTDGGGNWQDISGDLPRDARTGSHQLTWTGVNPDPPVLYVQRQYQEIYRSADGGPTWTPLGLEEHLVARAVKAGLYPELYGAAAGALAWYTDSGVP
jgi:hypothetical protein